MDQDMENFAALRPKSSVLGWEKKTVKKRRSRREILERRRQNERKNGNFSKNESGREG